MSKIQEKQCTHLIYTNKEIPSVKVIKDKLEKGSNDEKVNFFFFFKV